MNQLPTQTQQTIHLSNDTVPESTASRGQSIAPACVACGAKLVEIRAKLQCVRCRAICETCCEGARW